MHRGNSIEPPPRMHGAVSPWVEISAWILAFGILIAAQCAPERSTDVATGTGAAAARVSAVTGQRAAPRPPR